MSDDDGDDYPCIHFQRPEATILRYGLVMMLGTLAVTLQRTGLRSSSVMNECK